MLELEVTWRRALVVWWSLLWRTMVMAVSAALGGAMAGGLLGVVFAVIGLPKNVLTVACMFVGLAVGFAFQVVGIMWLLSKKKGEFRIALISNKSSME